ncbi:MAG: type II CAAX endopeptidase family protein [bacterium]|nr:type II CAAX endopeptidase family protein [bacterium]
MNENEQLTQTEEIQVEAETQAEKEYPVKNLQKKWYKAILYAAGLIALAFGIQIIIGGAAGIFLLIQAVLESRFSADVSPDEMTKILEDSGIINLVSAAASFAMAVTFGLWYKLKHAKHCAMAQIKETMKSAFTPSKTALFILTAVACYTIAVCTTLLIGYALPDTLDQYLDMAELVFEDGPLTLIMSLLFAPVAEECLVRGLIQRRLESYFPMIAVLLIESVCFGILHGNLVQGLYVIPLAMVTGYLSYQYRSVIPTILFHMLYNFMPRIINLIPEEITDRDGVWFAAAVILTAGVIVMQKVFSKKETQDAAKV